MEEKRTNMEDIKVGNINYSPDFKSPPPTIPPGAKAVDVPVQKTYIIEPVKVQKVLERMVCELDELRKHDVVHFGMGRTPEIFLRNQKQFIVEKFSKEIANLF